MIQVISTYGSSMTLSDFAEPLTEHERRAVASVFRIDQRELTVGGPGVTNAGGFLVCTFASRDESHCPFELHFGRHENEGRFNFFVGLGAEVHNYATLDEATRDDIEEDVARFLSSSVHCEQHRTDKGVVRAFYNPSKFVVEGAQIRLAYKNYSWPFFRYETECVNYAPWIEE